MAAVHEIGIAAETRAFDDGFKSGVIKPVSDAVDAFQKLDAAADVDSPDVDAGKKSLDGAAKAADSFADKLIAAARAAGKSDDDIERALRDMGMSADQARKAISKFDDEIDSTGRSGARSLDKLEDKLRDVQRASDKVDDSASDMADSSERSFRRMGDASREVGDEFRQNVSETFSSFRGDAEDFGQLAQDLLGGLAGAGGIAGALGLGAAAAGIGLLIQGFNDQNEAIQRVKDNIGGMWQTAAQEGRDYLDTAQLIAAANDLMFNTDRANEWKQVQEDAMTLGLDRITVADAQNGSLEAQRVVLAAVNAKLEEEGVLVDRLGRSIEGNYGGALNSLRDRWNTVSETSRESADTTQKALADTSARLLQAARDAGTATEEVDELGNKLLTLPDGEKIVIEAETGRAHQDFDRFKGAVEGYTSSVKTTTLRINVDDSAVRNYRPPIIRANLDLTVPRGRVVLY